MGSGTGAGLAAPGSSTRERILDLLREEPRNGWKSGEVLSSLLGISRAAVAKHVAVLREAGHVIEAVPRRGYRLVAEADSYSESAVRELLQTRVLGQESWTWLDETTSTNSVAALQALEGAREGSIVVARSQSSGRGRKGHQWISLPRSLAFSLILRPRTDSGGLELLTGFVLQAAVEAIESVCGLQAVIKQPNDILLAGRKVGGLLVETGFRAADLEWAVFGLGINVNARSGDIPEDLRDKATSLYNETGRPVGRAGLLREILERFERLYLGAQDIFDTRAAEQKSG